MSELPAEIESWIGETRYEQVGEFDVERGYIFASCASVENGNPLFWSEKAARDLTDGWIAPPTMLSVWFRPHYWAPDRTETVQPLQVHFDLKERLGLPEAVMTDNTIVFGAPVRPGDRLKTWQRYLMPQNLIKLNASGYLLNTVVTTLTWPPKF